MSENSFDYIIIGAGSAGCVLAAQLIRRTQARILLLEAGGDDRNLFIKMPAGVARIIAKKSWPYETEPEPWANHRRMQIAQGKVLGGSSSINGMIYLRGQQKDFDDWATQYGCSGWSYQEVLPYFKRAEDNESLADGYHGSGGLLPVSENRYRHPLSMAFLRAGQELNLPYSSDFNGASQLGVGFYQTTIRGGERASTSRSYLSAVNNEQRLVVRLNALAHRLTFEGATATGVVYSQNGGEEVTARAAKEVFVCAGALSSPKLLMLSGIGPREHLESLGIEVRADLPVGKNFHDHLHMSINASTKGPLSLFGADSGLRALGHAAQWLAFRSGVLTSNVLEGGAFSASLEGGRPDVQIHFLPLLDSWDDVPGEPLPATHGFTLKVGYLQPASRGEVLLRSTNPADPLKIHANYLQDPADLAGCVRAVKFGLGFLQTDALRPLIKEVLMPRPEWTRDDAGIEEFVRNFCKTVYHPVGSCRMGPSPEDSVTNPQLQVHGFERLRVVDGSVMPHITSGNTNAPTIMLAEKAVDLILGAPA